ncbi:hypothetical protein [Stieleria varia]|uniref:Uncharacterized protein n=1 Tax=Stieleria varia TaxID=2528005 RepID=A0A5C6A0M1_9BACT|nr:hypothetical protein [Stieleria varia]TWT92748.1 hypothetical protein Pla52n_61130 [Stieleria varia]
MLRESDFDSTLGRVVVCQVVVARSFRVMVTQAGGDVALFQAAPTLGAARRIAEAACLRHQARLEREHHVVMADPRRPRRVYVEQWVGTAIEGEWAPVPQIQGGFQRYFSDEAPGVEQRRIRSGEWVRCVLLDERTRRGGWRARLEGKRHIGPVLGDPPAGIKAGDTVLLKLSSLSHRSHAAQFAWT